MQYIIEDIVGTLKSGKGFVLATITEKDGSSPRGTGACMLVDETGAQKGTIGGGAVEFAAFNRAKELLTLKHSETQLYRLNTNQVADLGMICGGRVRVLFQYFAPQQGNTDLFNRLLAAKEKSDPACLVRKIQDGAVIETTVKTGSGLPNQAVLEEDILIEPVCDPAKVYIFGGGHVSQKLVPVLSYIEFSVTVCEDRPEFADKALFPAAAETKLLTSFEDISGDVTIKESDYVVIMTRGHQADYDILHQVLKTPATYIGCIGSRHKIALTKKRLFEEGFTEEDFARVHTPIGLQILAETPEEIAISVAGEMLEHRAKLR